MRKNISELENILKGVRTVEKALKNGNDNVDFKEEFKNYFTKFNNVIYGNCTDLDDDFDEELFGGLTEKELDESKPVKHKIAIKLGVIVVNKKLVSYMKELGKKYKEKHNTIASETTFAEDEINSAIIDTYIKGPKQFYAVTSLNSTYNIDIE